MIIRMFLSLFGECRAQLLYGLGETEILPSLLFASIAYSLLLVGSDAVAVKNRSSMPTIWRIGMPTTVMGKCPAKSTAFMALYR